MDWRRRAVVIAGGSVAIGVQWSALFLLAEVVLPRPWMMVLPFVGPLWLWNGDGARNNRGRRMEIFGWRRCRFVVVFIVVSLLLFHCCLLLLLLLRSLGSFRIMTDVAWLAQQNFEFENWFSVFAGWIFKYSFLPVGLSIVRHCHPCLSVVVFWLLMRECDPTHCADWLFLPEKSLPGGCGQSNEG